MDERDYKAMNKDAQGNSSLGSVRRSYLVKFVDPEKEYDVDYIIKQDGTKETGIFTLKGEDLTEKQILQLFLREAL